MSHSILMLVAGFAAGCGVMVVMGLLISSRRRRAEDEQTAQREETLQHINGLLADTDAVEASFRSGALSLDNFKQLLGDRINTVMRALRTHMHTLDVFYVKFVEQQAHEYLRILENPERRKTGLVRPDTPPVAATLDLGRSGAALAASAADDDEVPFMEHAGVPFAEKAAEPEAKAVEAPLARKVVEPEPETVEVPFATKAAEPAEPEAEEEEVSFTEKAAEADEEVSFAYEAEVAGVGEDFVGHSETVSQPVVADEAEAEPAADAWDSMEEFEAAFEQFEVQPPPAAVPPPSGIETGVFKISDVAQKPLVTPPPPPKPAPAVPPAPRALPSLPVSDDEFVMEVAPAAPAPRKPFEEAAMTETSSIDRSAITAALAAAAAQQAPPAPSARIPAPEAKPEEPPVLRTQVFAPSARPAPPQRISIPEVQPEPEELPPQPKVQAPAPMPQPALPKIPVPAPVPAPPPQTAAPAAQVVPPPAPQAVAPQPQKAPAAPPPKKAADDDPDMLNGDDVGDAIDAFFNLK